MNRLDDYDPAFDAPEEPEEPEDEGHAALVGADRAGYRRGVEEAATEVERWLNHNNAALRAGEMSQAEWRTAKAIIASAARDVRSLLDVGDVEPRDR